ncbi:MAG TPA: glycosyltransferase family 4 protein [Gemmatimonadales bacterium]|nr:glycosyltransferase family 4 protein [Gemmatimonadales bacterium]
MRVLLTLHQGSGSGAVHSVVRIARGLAERGVDVRLVCPPESPVEAEARGWGLVTHPLPLARAGRLTNGRRLRQLLAQHPVDLVNSHGSRDREALTWMRLTGRLPVPLILTRRSWPRSTWLETRLAAHAADRVTVLARAMVDPLVASGIPARLIEVVPNGVLLDRIDQPVTEAQRSAWRNRIGTKPDRRTVGIVARPKDQQVVLDALPAVRTPIHLVLAGLDGDALTRPLPPLPERHSVVRLPFDPEIRPLYDLLELVLHPSRWDALPQAVLEAMALEKPVIASDATGNAEILRHETDGLLVAPEDPRAWASAIDRVLGDPALAARLAASGRRRAREDFPFSRTIDRTLEVYRAVLAEHPTR